jgi:uncharacterized protein
MMDPDRPRIDKHNKQKCPICGKPSATDTKPFCSGRCQDVDLHRWLGGVYRIETDEGPNDIVTGEDPDRTDQD